VAFVNWNSIDVDSEGRAFVSLEERLVDRPGFTSVSLCRQADGVILTIPRRSGASGFEWSPRRLLPHFQYLPVIGIEEEQGADSEKTA
jgi:hypothetical protein